MRELFISFKHNRKRPGVLLAQLDFDSFLSVSFNCAVRESKQWEERSSRWMREMAKGSLLFVPDSLWELACSSCFGELHKHCTEPGYYSSTYSVKCLNCNHVMIMPTYLTTSTRQIKEILCLLLEKECELDPLLVEVMEGEIEVILEECASTANKIWEEVNVPWSFEQGPIRSWLRAGKIHKALQSAFKNLTFSLPLETTLL